MCVAGGARFFDRYNRTHVELKYRPRHLYPQRSQRYNRTHVELKFIRIYQIAKVISCYNRTHVELKSVKRASSTTSNSL